MDNKSKKSSPLVTVASEGGIAFILVLLILVTLNYFRILPLSQSFPILSFLPQQSVNVVDSQLLSQQSKNGNVRTTVRGIVKPYAPLKITNNTGNPLYQYVASSSAVRRGQVRIDIELLTTNQASTSGIIFNNGKKFQDKTYRHLRIFLGSQGNDWLLEYRGEGKSSYTFLKKPPQGGPDFKKFALVILPDGTGVTIISPAFASKTLKLPGSLYEGGSTINAVAQVGVNSTLTIYSLYYQFTMGAL